jgi:hypothetical protein
MPQLPRGGGLSAAPEDAVRLGPAGSGLRFPGARALVLRVGGGWAFFGGCIPSTAAAGAIGLDLLLAVSERHAVI